MHKLSKESATFIAGLQSRINELEGLTNEYKLIHETKKEREEGMFLSVMLTLLVINTEYSYSVVKINQIQAIEMVDKSDGGIMTITLKGNKAEQIVYSENNKDKWNAAKEWLEDNTFNLSSEISKQDVLRHKDAHPGF